MDIKFRNSENLEEIKNIILRSNAKNTIVWQNHAGSRKVFTCNLINYQEGTQTINFHLRSYDESLLVDRTVYVKLSFNESLFKGIIKSIKKNVIEVQIPPLVKTLDLRIYPREVFLPKDEKKVIIELSQDLTEDKKQRLTFNALDISVNGISIIVSDYNYKLMKNFMHLELVALGDHELMQTILLDCRYDQKFRYRLRGKVINANRFGFMFCENLEPSVLERFLR